MSCCERSYIYLDNMEITDYTKLGYQNLNGMRSTRVAPDQSKLVALMQRTGFGMVQQNGQRKYGGPPPAWTGPPPGRGCEVFVGKIPRDCFEDELVPALEKAGPLYEMRLMMDFSGTNRGYCFATYSNRVDAKRAVKELDKYEIRKGRYLGVNFSVDNCRLYLGSIPREKSRKDILEEMRRVTEGVVDVLVYPSSMDKTKNRGFAFVEYESHRAAALARKKVIPGKLELWGTQIIVDWAEPEQMVDEDIMDKVKNLYVRNLMPNTTEEMLHYVFERACGRTGSVDRVKRIKDFAFVHFAEREDALRAWKVMNGSRLEGAILEVALAKPVLKNCCSRFNRLQDREFLKGCMHECSVFHPDDCACGRPVLPMSYPYGKDNYGLRENHMYDLHPDMVMTPGDVLSHVHQASRSAVQVLEEVCCRNQWGSPIYELNTTMKHMSAATIRLYIFKVTIPSLASEQTATLFQVPKLCDDMDAAKEYSASHVLRKLRLLVTDLPNPPVAATPNILTHTLSSSADSQYTNSGSRASLDVSSSSSGAGTSNPCAAHLQPAFSSQIPSSQQSHMISIPSAHYTDHLSFLPQLQQLSITNYPAYAPQQY